jgi:exodeoxyribonuclease-3
LKICTFNANGIRAAEKKGFWQWFEAQNIDVLCIQETKAQLEKVKEIQWPKDYHLSFSDAQKPGYSGTAILSKKQPTSTQTHFNHDLVDSEGRVTLADYPDFQIASVYFPSGTSSELRQSLKMVFLDFAMASLFNNDAHKPIIVCGDVNIAHRAIDLKNDKANEKNSGYLPEERQWMDQLLAGPWVDIHRSIIGPQEVYTWWTYRSKARENNVGWRIDYQIASQSIAHLAKQAVVIKDPCFSDHAPLIIEYDLTL